MLPFLLFSLAHMTMLCSHSLAQGIIPLCLSNPRLSSPGLQHGYEHLLKKMLDVMAKACQVKLLKSFDKRGAAEVCGG